MATAPAFASTPAFGSAAITAQMTGTTTAPTAVTAIFTAGASGSRIDEIDICGLGTTIANVVRLWVFNGTTYYLLREIQVPATTASTTSPAYQQTLTFSNLVLPSSSYVIYAGLGIADTGFRISAFGGNF